MQLENRTVLITGATRGLGRALMEAFGSEGARVVGVARSQAELDQTVAELRTCGIEAHGIAADISDKEAIYPLVGAASALAGPIDILVQNASTLGPTPLPLLLDTSCEDFSRVLEVNLVGPLRLAKAVVGHALVKGHGLVMQITSDASVAAYPCWGAYGVSKAALDHLGRIWAAELEGTGVRFITVDPGEMDTRMHRDAIPDTDPATLARPEDVAARIVAMAAAEEQIPSGSRVEAMRWRPS